MDALQLFAAPYDPWVGWGGVVGALIFLRAHTEAQRAQARKAAAATLGLPLTSARCAMWPETRQHMSATLSDRSRPLRPAQTLPMRLWGPQMPHG